MVELADAPDSKSGEGDLVWVRFPPPAPYISMAYVLSDPFVRSSPESFLSFSFSLSCSKIIRIAKITKMGIKKDIMTGVIIAGLAGEIIFAEHRADIFLPPQDHTHAEYPTYPIGSRTVAESTATSVNTISIIR